MKKIISIFSDRGDRWERHDHGSWQSIIQTHSDHQSLINQWGGYSKTNNGSPKYITKRWKEIISHARRTVKLIRGKWVDFYGNELEEYSKSIGNHDTSWRRIVRM